MAEVGILIIDEILSPETYALRRASYLESLKEAVTCPSAKALSRANAIFKKDGELLSFQKIREREADNKLQPTAPRDFSIIDQEEGQQKFSREQYLQIDFSGGLSSAELAERNMYSVFEVNDDEFTALEILEREIHLEIDPLLPLPTTKNLQTVDNSLGTGELHHINVLDGMLLTEEQKVHVLASSMQPMTSGDLQDLIGGSEQSSDRPIPGEMASNPEVMGSEEPSAMPDQTGTTSGAPGVDLLEEEMEDSDSQEPEEDGEGQGEEEYEEYEEDEEDENEDEDEVTMFLPRIHRRIRNIVLATALPANAREAREAAAVRREALVRHAITHGHAKVSLRKQGTMACLPEFAATNREADAVLCVCGDSDEDFEGEWVACDTCQIWQHVSCMGEGVPKNRKMAYNCQQCDPFRHRRLIRRLRGYNPVPEHMVPDAA